MQLRLLNGRPRHVVVQCCRTSAAGPKQTLRSGSKRATWNIFKRGKLLPVVFNHTFRPTTAEKENKRNWFPQFFSIFFSLEHFFLFSYNFRTFFERYRNEGTRSDATKAPKWRYQKRRKKIAFLDLFVFYFLLLYICTVQYSRYCANIGAISRMLANMRQYSRYWTNVAPILNIFIHHNRW